MSKNELRQLALDLRRQNPEFQILHSQVAQQVADRFYQARGRFLDGLANKPKKKKPYRYLSLVYPQSGWKLSDTREVGLGKNKKKKARLKQNRLLYFNPPQGASFGASVSSVRQTQPLWSNLHNLLSGGGRSRRGAFIGGGGARERCGCGLGDRKACHALRWVLSRKPKTA